MRWIVTATGHELDIINPNQAQIDAMSVAWSLAQTNLLNGHTVRPYSAAEHALLVCSIVTHMGVDVHGRFAALVHCAHIAFSGLVHPFGKSCIGSDWTRWEDHWINVTATAFACRTALKVHADVIQQANLIALATARRDLLPWRADTPWPTLTGVEPLPGKNLYSPIITMKTWEDWRDAWLDKFHELETERTDALFPVRSTPEVDEHGSIA